jgi:MFS family permease
MKGATDSKLLTSKRYAFEQVLVSVAAGVSTFGNQGNVLAVSNYLKDMTVSPFILSCVMALASLSAAFAASLGGYFGTRFDRRAILVSLNFLSTVVCAGMAYASSLPYKASWLGVAFGFVCLAALAQAQAPVFRALLFTLVPQSKLLSLNARIFTINQGASLFGQSVATAFYTIMRPFGLLLIDGLSYALASICFLLLPKTKERNENHQVSPQRFFDWSALFQQPSLRKDLILLSLTNLLISPLVVYLPFVTKQGGQDLGFYYIAISVGAALGGLLVAKTLNFSIASLVLLLGLSRMGLGLVDTTAGIASLVFMESLFAGVLAVRMMTQIQLATDAQQQARIMGIVGALLAYIVPLGMILGGTLLELWPKHSGFTMMMTGSGLLLLGFWQSFKKGQK